MNISIPEVEYRKVYQRERGRGNPNARLVARAAAMLVRIGPNGDPKIRAVWEQHIAKYSAGPARSLGRPPSGLADPVQFRFSRDAMAYLRGESARTGTTVTQVVRNLIDVARGSTS